MTLTTLDLETVGTARALALPYPREERAAPKNYGPEAAEKWYAKDEAEWTATRAKQAALSPRLGRIVCVGLKVGDGPAQSVVELDEARERSLVEYALDAIDRAQRLVTFNGLSFDLPFLHVRAAILGVKIPYRTSDYLRRYTTWPHADLRMILGNWDHRAEGTLHDWATAFGLPVTDQSSGADIAAYVAAGDSEAIHQHCESDVALTAALADKLMTAGLL